MMSPDKEMLSTSTRQCKQVAENIVKHLPENMKYTVKQLSALILLLSLFALAILYMIKSETSPIRENQKNLKEDVKEMSTELKTVKKTLDEKVESRRELVLGRVKVVHAVVKPECIKEDWFKNIGD